MPPGQRCQSNGGITVFADLAQIFLARSANFGHDLHYSSQRLTFRFAEIAVYCPPTVQLVSEHTKRSDFRFWAFELDGPTAAIGAKADWPLAAPAIITRNGKNWVVCCRSASGDESDKTVLISSAADPTSCSKAIV